MVPSPKFLFAKWETVLFRKYHTAEKYFLQKIVKIMNLTEKKHMLNFRLTVYTVFTLFLGLISVLMVQVIR